MKKKIAMKQEQERDKERGPFSAGEQLIFFYGETGIFWTVVILFNPSSFWCRLMSGNFQHSPLHYFSYRFVFFSSDRSRSQLDSNGISVVSSLWLNRPF